MKKDNLIIYGSLILIAILLFINRKKIGNMFEQLRKIFLDFEGFSPKPLWDVKQWSWGYGTKVPGSSNNPNDRPKKTITKEQAFKDAFSFTDSAAKQIFPKIKVPLNENQKAAILSFAYNLGTATSNGTPVGNLIQDINSGDKSRIEYGFKAYNRADGKVLSQLTRRRKYEFELFYS